MKWETVRAEDVFFIGANMATDTITGDILADARKNTERILNRKNLSATDRANFENQQLILMFIESNHKKTTEMYFHYQRQKENSARWLTFQNAIIVIFAGDILARIITYLFQP